MKVFRLFVAFTLVCLAFPPYAHAVSPPPDGGYPGGNTAEGKAPCLASALADTTRLMVIRQCFITAAAITIPESAGFPSTITLPATEIQLTAMEQQAPIPLAAPTRLSASWHSMPVPAGVTTLL